MSLITLNVQMLGEEETLKNEKGQSG